MKTKKNIKPANTLKMYWYSKTVPFYCPDDQSDSKDPKAILMGS